MLAKRKSSEDRNTAAAFTLVELIMVVAMLALAGLCLVPALARTTPDTRAFQCLNNHRQLSRAWRMYADDNNERLAPNYAAPSPPAFPSYPVWAFGWLDWGAPPVNTNTILLTDPRYSALALYCGKDARPFKCPADQFLSATQRSRGWRERVRSVSKSYGLGGGTSGYPFDQGYYLLVRKWTELVKPSPSDTWLSMDEHPDSINDGDLLPPTATQWFDLPANYHDGGAGVAFADGRGEIHRWESSVLKVPITLGFFSAPVTPADDPDLLWVRNHTPKQPGAN